MNLQFWRNFADAALWGVAFAFFAVDSFGYAMFAGPRLPRDAIDALNLVSVGPTFLLPELVLGIIVAVAVFSVMIRAVPSLLNRRYAFGAFLALVGALLGFAAGTLWNTTLGTPPL